MMRTLVFPMAVAVSLFAGPVAAQDNNSWDRIVLEDKAGNVMTSVGGEYETAPVGKHLQVGEHMMLSGNTSKAKVVYYELDDEGDVVRKCVKDYTDPNTYIIDATCTPVAAWTGSTAGNGMNAGIIVGAGVIGAVLLNTDDNVDVGPLSSSVRHL